MSAKRLECTVTVTVTPYRSSRDRAHTCIRSQRRPTSGGQNRIKRMSRRKISQQYQLAMLSRFAQMVGVARAMPEAEMRELLHWEKKHLGTPEMMGTDDWPGWKKYIADPPALPADSAEDRAGNIYLIRANDGRHKIGRTQNMGSRLRDFRSLIEFELLHTFPADDHVRAERLLHRQFSEKKIKGEWFDLSDSDVVLICRLSKFEEGEFRVEASESRLRLRGYRGYGDKVMDCTELN